MSTPTDKRQELQRGYGSEERPLTRDLWARDSRPAVLAMTQPGNFDPDNTQVDFKRFWCPDFARLEHEKVWMKTWLFACRDEDLPNVGDRVPLQVGPRSFFVIRSGPDEFKAFYNSCLHRGMQLCQGKEEGASIRCPYHAWEWKADGTLKYIPSHWDFRSVKAADYKLREVKLGRWGGFIFINADPDAPPLEEALSVVPSHFHGWKVEERYTAARFRKHVPANWKLAQEAFLEAYHVVATHPAAIPYNADSQAQYDVWESEHGHIGRQSTPSAIPSIHALPDATPFAAAEVYAQIMKAWHYPDAELPRLDPAQPVRPQIAEWHRQVQEKFYGVKPDYPDAIMLDSLLYFMFPMACFWLSESLPFTYQFLPHPSDPEKCFFEVRMLLPVPKGQPRPPSSPTIEVGEDEQIADKAPAFGFLGIVFDQDMANMRGIQNGVKSADPTRMHSQLGSYQEFLVQHWHSLLDRYMAR